MIGVIAKPNELLVVEEFFQLFKTPWERFDAAHAYEMILSTGEVSPDVDCPLVVLCSSNKTTWDGQSGFNFRRRLSGRLVEINGQKLPIYGALATHSSVDGRFGVVSDDPEALGCELVRNGRKTVRLGYDLFAEVDFLLSQGQRPQNAVFPTLDLHIEILRRIMLDAGLAVVEIPPVPASARFISCLTHDIDFFSIRQHRFDRATLGFFYRATLATTLDYLRGRCSWGKVIKNLAAAVKWPLVHFGLCEDFWVPFGNYLEAEQGRPSTFFLIPFKNRCGKAPSGRDSKRRSVRYDVGDLHEWLPTLKKRGCEVAVHGIDSWDDVSSGREELTRHKSVTAETPAGVRMHWLYFSEQSPQVLEAAGYGYDSTCGYNDAVGFKAGTSQVFLPIGLTSLFELPLHVQDTAMFFPGRLHLSESDAWELFSGVVRHCRAHGGVLTVLWHDRSLVPERLWDDFYDAVLKELSAASTWFATARDVVAWFRGRRKVRFQAIRQEGDAIEVSLEGVPTDLVPDLVIRVSLARGVGKEPLRIETPLKGRNEISLNLSAPKDRVEETAASV